MRVLSQSSSGAAQVTCHASLCSLVLALNYCSVVLCFPSSSAQECCLGMTRKELQEEFLNMAMRVREDCLDRLLGEEVPE